MHSTCHVITDLRTSSVPGMFELYCRGSIFRLAMRGGAPPDLTMLGNTGPFLILMDGPVDAGMEVLRDVMGRTPALRSRTLVVHGTATGWRVDLGSESHVRMQPAEVHPLAEGPCTFWLPASMACRPGSRLREGWYTGEVLKAHCHPDGVEGDLQAILHRLMIAEDPYEALDVDRRAGAAALNAAYLKLMASHQPGRISPAESERRLDLHRRIRETALRIFGLAEAA